MSDISRDSAAETCIAAMDTEFFKALCEPSRLEVVKVMIKLGKADIGEIAGGTMIDRSVVSRHLQVLERAGLAIRHKEGRHVLYELNGPAIMQKLQQTLEAVVPLIPFCCPSDEGGT